MHHLLFIFLDGVGLGDAGPANPFSTLSLPAFERLTDGQRWTRQAAPVDRPDHLFKPIDACLGVDGLPQSGTGQATLFTGINGAKLAGRHYGPYPHSKTKPAIDEHNLFSQLARVPSLTIHDSAFANAYPPRFFQYARERDRWTVTTRCCLAAGLPIRGVDALQQGLALTADITRAGWHRLDLGVDPIEEATAARHLYALSRAHRVMVFEYYLTDKAGHSRSPERAAAVLASLDAFFGALLDHLQPADDLLLITSDHGNLEDLSIKSHTRNPAPLIAYGDGARHFQAVTDLTGVVPAILEAVQAAVLRNS